MSRRSRDPRHGDNMLRGRRPVNRRRFLELVAGTGAVAVVAPLLGDGSAGRALAGIAGAADAAPVPPGYVVSYPDGIVAGDPLPTGTVIGTRVGAPGGGEAIDVLWEVGTDDTFATIAAGGVVTATAATGHTVKVVVDSLAPDRWYRYRFTVDGTSSVTGRLRTAPAPGASPDVLRFAYASCQQRSSLYVALRAIAEEPDLDFFMHLGDYVYVSDNGTISLDDYRGVYRTFKSDPLLQQCHAAVPLAAMWDDGEFYNGIDRTGDPTRLAAAKRAWFETMPVVPPVEDPEQSYRRFGWGDLADVFMLDLRAYRDPPVEAIDTSTPEGMEMFNPARTTLGAAQKQWFKQAMSGSTTAWRLLGNSYNMGVWRLQDLDEVWPRPPGQVPNAGVYIPNEAWDDYQAERKELLTQIADEQIPNVISFSAHTHIWLASHMKPDIDDPTSPVVAFDFTTGSLTADPDVLAQGSSPAEQLAFYTNLANSLLAVNTHMTYTNFVNHGYTTVEVTECATTVEYKTLDTRDPDAQPVTLARFRVHSGADRMESQMYPIPCFNCGPGVETPATGISTGLTPIADTCAPTTPTPPPPGTTGATTATPVSASPSFTG